MIKRITSICLAMMMVLSFIPVLGMQEAYADGVKVNDIVIDLSEGPVTLSGDSLEAFQNIINCTNNGMYIYRSWIDINYPGSYPHYDLQRTINGNDWIINSFDQTDLAGKSFTYVVPDGVKEQLNNEGKKYCDTITVTIPKYYNLWIEGKQVSSANADEIKGKGDKSVSYNDETKTLTLNGATLKIKSTNAGSWTAIDTTEELNLKLIGINSIILDGVATAEFASGIDAKKINVYGPGSLDINIDTDKKCYGICAGGDLTVDGAKITCNVKTVSGILAYSVAAINNTIELKNGASLKAEAYGDNPSVEGIRANRLSVSENSTLEAISDIVAVNVNNIDDATKARGAWVNDTKNANGARLWDTNESLGNYKYVRMPLVSAAEKAEAERKAAAERAAKYSPGKVTLKSAKKGKKRATVTWRTMKNVAGYQISLTNKKNGSVKTVTVKQTKKVAKKKTVRKVVKKLSKKTKYRVQVRAYRTVGGETFYGPWSKAKNVKTR